MVAEDLQLSIPNINTMKLPDYIIVGSGAAGAVMANRLTVDPNVSVLLLEAGASNWNPITKVPKGFFFTAYTPKYSKYFTKSFNTEKYGNGAFEHWTRGRLIGGSTEVNGMVWNRGWAPDYDQMEKEGNAGWNWEHFVNAFREIEDHELGATSFRGAGGPVHISTAKPKDETTEAFIAAAEALGIDKVDDLNGSDKERVGYTSSNIKNGFRVGASEAFLAPIKHRKNLTVITHADVDKVLFEGKRAVGVRARVKGVVQDFKTKGEVFLAAGALDSPLILERSGIGDPAVLKKAGVELLFASPNVGNHLREHRGLSLMYDLRRFKGFNHQLSSLPRQLFTGFKYLFTRKGVMSYGGYNCLTFFKSTPGLQRPDTQGMFTPISLSPTKTMMPNNKPGAMFLVYQLRPDSEGSIHIVSADPMVPPKLDAGFLKTEKDRLGVVSSVRKGREIMAQSPISQYATETFPGPAVTSDEDIISMALNYGATGYHALGTVAMGPNDDDVVDGHLRVRGVTALRVIDASFFRHLPAGNNNAATMAGAWTAADIIEKERSEK